MLNILQEPVSSVLIDCPELKLVVEEYMGEVSLHTPRIKITPQLVREYRDILEDVKNLLREAGYKRVLLAYDKSNPKDKKIGKLFGFQYYYSLPEHEVYVLWLRE